VNNILSLGVRLFQAGLTKRFYSSFVSSYQTMPQFNQGPEASEPFVYVDKNGVRLVTQVVDLPLKRGDIFALSVAEDGLIEVLSS
jgi:hypothetical protein